MKSTLHRRFFKNLLLVFLIFANSVVIARDLSEVVLSKEDQENYYDYQVDVFLQIEGYGDQELKTKYPDLVKSNAESLKKFMQSLDIINHSEFPGLEKNNKESISAYMRNAEVIDHHNDIKEAMVGRYLEDFSLNTFEEEQVAVYPTVHIKSDLAVNESLVVDYPLIVEGDLIVEGNLVIKNATPILVLGDVFVSNNFLYDIPVDGQESYLYIKGKLEIEGDAFVYGTIVAEKESAKNIFSLSTSSYLSDGLIPFPNSPLLVKPSILPWSDEVDSDVLFHYLKRGIEPFTKPYEKTPETKPWEFFINSWSGISSNYYYNPEIAGLKYVTIDVDELSNEGKQQLEKLDGYELAHADVRTAQGFCTDNNVLKLDETSDSAFLFDSAAFKRKLAQTAEVAIYGDLKLEEYTSSCALRSRYDSFNSMFRGRLSSSYASPYGDYTEDDYSQAYQRDKNFLSVDPYLSTYWLLRFGIRSPFNQ